jgi:hypothetical protein
MQNPAPVFKALQAFVNVPSWKWWLFPVGRDFNKILLYKLGRQSKFMYPNNARIALYYWDILSW